MTELDKTLLQQLRRLHAPDCPAVGTLGDFLDGKLSPEERQALDAHLRACPACINRLIDLRELALLAKEGEPPPRALTKKLKRLALFLATGEETGPSVWERITTALAATWAAVWQWTAPRFIGEIVAASAAAVLLVFLFTTPVQHGTQEGKEAITAFTALTPKSRVYYSRSRQCLPVQTPCSNKLFLLWKSCPRPCW